MVAYQAEQRGDSFIGYWKTPSVSRFGPTVLFIPRVFLWLMQQPTHVLNIMQFVININPYLFRQPGNTLTESLRSKNTQHNTNNKNFLWFEWHLGAETCRGLFDIFDIHGSVHHKRIFKSNQQDATLHSLFISVKCSTCFRRLLRPSSGAQNCIYIIGYFVKPLLRQRQVAVKAWQSTRCCIYSYELLMTGGGTAWNM